ncbi:hypothetical protein RsoM2USA_117 [Ralstonia phage RsoM2USA]|nr:hypothetical protein RsoM2USA_117 [Ralstonia phage RsoM2USA]
MIRALVVYDGAACNDVMQWDFPWSPTVGDILNLTINGETQVSEILRVVHAYTDSNLYEKPEAFLRIEAKLLKT